MKNLSITILFCLGILFSLGQNTNVNVDPASQQVSINDQFTTDIEIENVNNLGGFCDNIFIPLEKLDADGTAHVHP